MDFLVGFEQAMVQVEPAESGAGRIEAEKAFAAAEEGFGAFQCGSAIERAKCAAVRLVVA